MCIEPITAFHRYHVMVPFQLSGLGDRRKAEIEYPTSECRYTQYHVPRPTDAPITAAGDRLR